MQLAEFRGTPQQTMPVKTQKMPLKTQKMQKKYMYLLSYIKGS